MSTFNTNKNAFLSSVQLLKNDFHAYASLGVTKGSRNEKQQKRSIINNINSNRTISEDLLNLLTNFHNNTQLL